MEAAMKTEVAPLDQERAFVYCLLASLLRDAPTQTQLNHLAGLDIAEGEPGSDAWRLLTMAAAQTSPPVQEFQDLFVGVGRGELVPYGSWYLTGFLMEKPLLNLRRELADLGYRRDESVAEPEDHVAALCEVMFHLIQDQQCAGQQAAFFAQHLGTWLPRFFTDLQQAKCAVFYQAVGFLGSQFIELEQDYLGINQNEHQPFIQGKRRST